MILQAIVTKFIGPTNTRGSRVKATAAAGSITIEWSHALNSEENHTAAAKALAEKYGWGGKYYGGGMPDKSGNTVFVNIESYEKPSFETEQKR